MSKKMYPNESNSPARREGKGLHPMEYTLPVYHDTKCGAYVDFKAFDPTSGKLKRKKYSLDKITKKRERKAAASDLIFNITAKLRKGWTPWVDLSDDRGFAKIEVVLQRYLEAVEKKSRKKTRQAYGSRVNVLQRYIADFPVPMVYVYQLDTPFFNRFLDWIYLDQDVSERTRNNYRGWCVTLCEFMIERGWMRENPAKNLKKIRESGKIRKPLSAEMLQDLRRYLMETGNRPYLMACMFLYYTFIRPTELVNIRVSHIDRKAGTVFIPGAISKNAKDATVVLNPGLLQMLEELRVFDSPGDFYVFGPTLRTSPVRASSEIFRRQWKHIRDHFQWGREYQFYSLKDSGLRDLIAEAGVVVARDQARHSDISITNAYLQDHSVAALDPARKFKGGLDYPTAKK